GPMTATALKELKDLMGADAAWFRLLERHRLTVFQQIGLSPEFLFERASVPAGDPAEHIPEEVRPVILACSQLGEKVLPVFQREKLHQLVLIAVPGRKSPVGNLVLASRRAKSYAPEELDFLVTCAQQLGR